MPCKLCGSDAEPFAEATMLHRHPVQYFRCCTCGFVQTEDPYWLDEAYAEAITRSDIGLASRSVGLALITQAVILTFFDRRGRFLDYGGGYGLLVRLMRDFGFDYYLHDKYCANLFARGFEDDLSDKRSYELVTAFEVFEHLPEPRREIEQMLQSSRSVLFTTQFVATPPPKPDEWWYYGLEHGQHVALYTRKSLALSADRLGLNFFSDGKRLHLLTERRLSPSLFRLITRLPIAALRSVLRRRQSLLPDDYFALTGRHLE